MGDVYSEEEMYEEDMDSDEIMEMDSDEMMEMDFDNEEKPGDQFFEDQGIRLALDMKSFLYLAGTELDFSDGLNGKGFNFINPNASRTCGCGESFSV
jgi:iron-sulfur cluster assembly protein